MLKDAQEWTRYSCLDFNSGIAGLLYRTLVFSLTNSKVT